MRGQVDRSLGAHGGTRAKCSVLGTGGQAHVGEEAVNVALEQMRWSIGGLWSVCASGCPRANSGDQEPGPSWREALLWPRKRGA